MAYIPLQAGLWGWEIRRRKSGYERSGLGGWNGSRTCHHPPLAPMLVLGFRTQSGEFRGVFRI